MGATNVQAQVSTVLPLSVETDQALYAQGNTVTISGFIKTLNEDYSVDVTLIIIDPTGNIVSIDQITPNSDGTYETSFIADGPLWKTGGEFIVKAQYGAQKIESTFDFAGGTGIPPPPPPPGTTEPPVVEPPPPVVEPPPPDPEPTEPKCGTGTHLENGQCVPDTPKNGCLIATAAFGSELSPQVQMLREIRDNTVLSTSSGTAFMAGFNQFYYSFSPTIADWERESPAFQDVVRVTLTPLLTSLSLLNYVDIDSEGEMLGYGISLIILNLGMYFVAPAIVILKIKNRFT